MTLLTLMLVGCGKALIEKTTQSETSQEVAREASGIEESAEDVKGKEEELLLEESIPTLEEKLELYMSNLSLEEKVGQLFVVAFRKDAAGEPITKITSSIEETLKLYPVGGVILFKENLVEPEQTKTLIEDLQQQVEIPLWISVDEEGGVVSRVGGNTIFNAQPFSSAAALGKGTQEAAYQEARRMGRLLTALGFNMDFAPVGDIYNEPTNTVIGSRSFGTSSEAVVPYVLAFAKGLIDEGIQPVVKHFPGHGNTIEDSHDGLAYVYKSLEALEKEELVPFEAAINNGVGAIMMGHLVVPEVDEVYPASLSKVWKAYMERYDLSEVLKITDALDMGAIINHYEVGEAAILALEAGNDICLMPSDLAIAYQSVLEAVLEKRLTEEEINSSIRKILSKKVSQNLLVLE